MVAQRKEVEWESEQALPRRNKIRKTVQQRRQEKNLNNALRTRCMILFVITTVLAVFFILRSGMAATRSKYSRWLSKLSLAPVVPGDDTM